MQDEKKIPAVGEFGTEFIGSDAYDYFITWVSEDKKTFIAHEIHHISTKSEERVYDDTTKYIEFSEDKTKIRIISRSQIRGDYIGIWYPFIDEYEGRYCYYVEPSDGRKYILARDGHYRRATTRIVYYMKTNRFDEKTYNITSIKNQKIDLGIRHWYHDPSF